ncbi:hypothetical protein [uncultured Paludibaculum sp.]|uniref:hypothetical protein n=1 Tax=uncultured Paludibaculum sp. TaxID=1765020 RepID=UPI002AABE6BC|nr:hypothetical protein [uncultured Paludibaculum sp.]
MRLRIRLYLVLMLLSAAGFAVAFSSDQGAPAEYLGGTLASLEVGQAGSLSATDSISFIFISKRSVVRVPYERINLLEYGQKVDRRLWEAIVISPLMILSKKRSHYLAIGFEAEDGKQQAMLFRVEKNSVRAMLVSLEARTGRKVTFMDEEARKAGKG